MTTRFFAIIPVIPWVAFAGAPPTDIEEIVRTWFEHPGTKAPSICIAAFNRDGLLWQGGWGLADVEHNVPSTPETRYHFASVTKLATTLLLAQSVAAGTVGLDDPVSRYIPDFSARYPEPGARPITLRDLATHTAGLTNWWKYSVNAMTERELVAWFGDAGFAVQPGLEYKYSNFGFSVLGLALARAEQRPWAELLRDRVLAPLDMTSTGLDELYEHSTLARGYWYRDGERQVRPRSAPFRAHAPASAIVSTVGDMAQFGRAHLAETAPAVVSTEMTDLLFRVYHYSGASNAIGLGWHYCWSGGVPRWYHLGAWNYNYSRLAVRPDVGIGVVLVTNGPWTHDPTVALLKALAPQADTARLDACTGVYVDPAGEQTRVRRVAGPELLLEIEGAGRLIPLSRHTFFVAGRGWPGGQWVRFGEEDGARVMLYETRRLVRRAAEPAP